MDLPEEKLEQFRCENCGGTLKWNITRQQIECASCKQVMELNDKKKAIRKHAVKSYSPENEVELPELTVLKCDVCGAELEFDSDDTAKVCPLCGATNVWSERHSAEAAPDGILPFEIDKPEAQRLFREWVKGRWFAPNKLKQAYQQGKLEGMYVPFWIFDAKAHGKYTGKGGTEISSTDDEGNDDSSIVWTKETGWVEEKFTDIEVIAAASQVRDAIGEILPYDVEDKMVPFSSIYLSGFSAERYAIKMPYAFDAAKDIMKKKLKEKAMEDIKSRGYDEAKVSTVEMEVENGRYQHALFPAWFSTYAYGGKQYLYIINGQDGRVGGKRPYSIPKIAAALIAVTIILLFIFSIVGEAAGPEEMQSVQEPSYTVEQQIDNNVD